MWSYQAWPARISSDLQWTLSINVLDGPLDFEQLLHVAHVPFNKVAGWMHGGDLNEHGKLTYNDILNYAVLGSENPRGTHQIILMLLDSLFMTHEICKTISMQKPIYLNWGKE